MKQPSKKADTKAAKAGESTTEKAPETPKKRAVDAAENPIKKAKKLKTYGTRSKRSAMEAVLPDDDVASEDEGPKSDHAMPPPRRQDPEDYNIRSDERTQLLSAIKHYLPEGASLTFWAGCQLADIQKLKNLLQIAEIDGHVIDYEDAISQDLPLICKLTDLILIKEMTVYRC
jgi:hypothetical protein